MKCLNCNKELIQIKGKRLKKFCNDACRMSYKRKVKSEQPNPNILNPNTGKSNPNIKSEHLENMPEFATIEERVKYIETHSIKHLKEKGIWIPNWKRAGKTKKQAQIHLMEIIQKIPCYYSFMGYNIEL